MTNDALSLTVKLASVTRERDAYRRVAIAVLALIREGQATPGLHDTTKNRCESRYDVVAMGKLEAELERLEG